MTAETFIIGDSRGQWFIVADADTLDEAQSNGRWIKTTEPVEARQ